MKHGLTRYKKGPDEHGTEGKGCRCATCLGANRAWQRNQRRMIAYGRWEGWADAAGTQRRIQALMWNGWSMGLLSARLGCDRQVLRKKLHDRGRFTAATVRAVRALYEELWDQPPPERDRFGRRNATMARRYARERGWCPAAAWDDDPGPHYIDDPAAVPVPGWDTEPRPARQPASPLVAAGIRQARERAGLSQRALAAAVGVTESCVQLWEYAKRAPGDESWVQLELTLGPLGVVRDRGAGDGDGQQRQGSEAA